MLSVKIREIVVSFKSGTGSHIYVYIIKLQFVCQMLVWDFQLERS